MEKIKPRKHKEVPLCVKHDHVWRFIRFEAPDRSKEEEKRKTQIMVTKCMKCGVIHKS